jgi:hypothetical protein
MSDSYRSSAKPARKEVVVASFDTPHEAELARMFLESRNIQVSLRDDMLVGTAQLYSNAFGGVKLLTDVEDAPEAQELLDDYRSRHKRRKKKKRERADDVAKRAFRASVIGIIICPGVLHMYSLLLLAELNRGRLSPSGKRQASAAFALSCAVIGALTVALISSC